MSKKREYTEEEKQDYLELVNSFPSKEEMVFELMNSYLNGNISYVIAELKRMSPMLGIWTALAMANGLQPEQALAFMLTVEKHIP